MMTPTDPIRAIDFIERCQSFISHRLPPATQSPTRLHEAMRYAVLNPGKRLRPQLVYITGQCCAVDLAMCDYIAAAVECIHAYSLIHDDLPAMDNDDLRRGKPTCHKAFDEATAILAGDALQSFAFRLLASSAPALTTPALACELMKMLGDATGSEGMAGGQMFDIQSGAEISTEADLSRLHQMKTGALIAASILMPAKLSMQCDAQSYRQLRDFADWVGLGFQIQDDILDVTSPAEQTGKTSGSDARLEKCTYPSLLGLDGARQRTQDCLTACLDALQSIPFETRALASIAKRMIVREK